MPLLFALIVVLLAFGLPARAQPADAAEIVAADRALAADTLRLGSAAATLRWRAPDAVEPQTPGRRTGRGRTVAGAPLAPTFSPPDWAGIAKSGDLGFTARSVAIDETHAGDILTIWQRQTDGQWRWILQGGVVPTVGSTQPETTAALATSILASSSPDTAVREVAAVEAVLASAALIDQARAHQSLLAPDARLFLEHQVPTVGPDQFATALATWPDRLTLDPPTNSGASAAGDLVWTYGRVGWTRDQTPRTGHYLHLWQKRSGGWALIFAQILSDPPPARG